MKCYDEVYFSTAQNVKMSRNRIYYFCYLPCCNRKLDNTAEDGIPHCLPPVYATIHILPLISPLFDLLFHVLEILPFHFHFHRIVEYNIAKKRHNLDNFSFFIYPLLIGFFNYRRTDRHSINKITDWNVII